MPLWKRLATSWINTSSKCHLSSNSVYCNLHIIVSNKCIMTDVPQDLYTNVTRQRFQKAYDESVRWYSSQPLAPVYVPILLDYLLLRFKYTRKHISNAGRAPSFKARANIKQHPYSQGAQMWDLRRPRQNLQYRLPLPHMCCRHCVILLQCAIFLLFCVYLRMAIRDLTLSLISSSSSLLSFTSCFFFASMTCSVISFL